MSEETGLTDDRWILREAGSYRIGRPKSSFSRTGTDGSSTSMENRMPGRPSDATEGVQGVFTGVSMATECQFPAFEHEIDIL